VDILFRKDFAALSARAMERLQACHFVMVVYYCGEAPVDGLEHLPSPARQPDLTNVFEDVLHRVGPAFLVRAARRRERECILAQSPLAIWSIETPLEPPVLGTSLTELKPSERANQAFPTQCNCFILRPERTGNCTPDKFCSPDTIASDSVEQFCVDGVSGPAIALSGALDVRFVGTPPRRHGWTLSR